MDELAYWKARGRVRKVFFWDAIFTLDPQWMAEFAAAYRREIAIPFECYTHPQTMTRDMARWLAEAGCIMVRVGVQSVNSDTLAAVDRKGDREKVVQTLRHLCRVRRAVLGRSHHRPAGRGRRRPARCAALLRRGAAEAHRHPLDDLFPGHDGARSRPRSAASSTTPTSTAFSMATSAPATCSAATSDYRDHDELRHLSGVFDLLPLLPREAIEWLLDRRRYRHLRGVGLMRQLGTLALAIRGEPATREHVRHILATTLGATRAALRRKLDLRGVTPAA